MYVPLAPGAVLAEGDDYMFIARWRGDVPRPDVAVLEDKLEAAGFDHSYMQFVGADSIGGFIEPDEAGLSAGAARNAAGELGATGAVVATETSDGPIDDETADWWKKLAAGLAIPGVIIRTDDPPSAAEKRAWLLTWGPLLLGLASLGVGLYMAFGRKR